jgi:hypothetical protein
MQMYVASSHSCERRGTPMPYQDFRQFLDVLRQHGTLKRLSIAG